MAGSKVRASGSVLQRDAGVAAIARFLHKAGAEGVHGRGGIGSEKGLSGRGYVNGGRVASLPGPTTSRYIAPQPLHDGGGWAFVKVVVVGAAEARSPLSRSAMYAVCMHAQLRMLRVQEFWED